MLQVIGPPYTHSALPIFNSFPNVSTLYATVDVLTSTHIIVIRELAQWAEGLGMLY